ncbi:DUF4233 domain-containing protein [Nocardioides sp. CPCC 206347]|uniref:DUF4233 domain-containing protein n=1 Tax=unclassified Nocardioides TaxID=2615069 RepID=UPI003607378C
MSDPTNEADTSEQAGPPDPERQKSPRRAMCAAVLSLEAITLGLTIPVMISLSDVRPAVALSVGLGLAVACVLAAGMLRRDSAYYLGHAIQVAAIGLGFVVGIMWALGPLFALLWGAAYWLGRKIEQERADAFAAYDRGRESQV